MSRQESISAEIAEIVARLGSQAATPSAPSLGPTDDLGLDGQALLEVVAAVEDRFDVRVPCEDLPRLRTLGDASAYLDSRLHG